MTPLPLPHKHSCILRSTYISIPFWAIDADPSTRFRKAGYATIDRICDYYYSLSSLPVKHSVSPGYLFKHIPPDLPQTGQPFNEILDDYSKLILPGLTLWQHPLFFGFYPAACTFEGMIADLLISSAGNPGFNVSVRRKRLKSTLTMSSLVGIQSSLYRARDPYDGLGSWSSRSRQNIFQFLRQRRWCNTSESACFHRPSLIIHIHEK